MEKNTVIAIVLAGVILFAGTFITQKINENHASSLPEVQQEGIEAVDSTSSEPKATESPEEGTTEITGDSGLSVSTLPEQEYPVRTIVEETDLYRIEFSTKGGVAKGIFLQGEFDDGEPISMVLDDGSGVGTFNISFGGREVPYIDDVFKFEKTTRGKERILTFSRDYLKDGQVFTLSKIYRIIPGEYIIELRIVLETPDGKAVPLLDGNEAAYTLTYGPQIGPEFDKIDGRYEIRDNVSWGPDPKNGKWKRQVHRSGRNRETVVETDSTVNWAGIIGKYFAVIVDPGSGSAKITWDGRPADGQDQASRLQISRAARRESVIEDVYRFYIGPLDRANLHRYDSAEDNAFGISGMGLQNAPKTSSWLGWLESILRWTLEQFYKMIPNFGVAIVLLTILVKALLFPFTHKSYESSSKMQAIQPKIKELQEQYKGDPQKLNAKTGELYKAEGVNPMGGCLPMLFQFPIFIALYGLLNRYFPLRGATFIPGWIIDLSAPEHIVQFESGINFMGNTYDAIRLLPILYLGGQLLMTKVTQQGSAGAQTGMQQKMLTLGMPIMFFFILYNMPSGLLLYWTTMNIITIIQQLVTNYIKKRKAAGGAA
jgi:YidC/Oxa1 family membrane protein insertase